MTENERAALEKFKADYNELCHLKDMKIAILEEKLAENIKEHTKLQIENEKLKRIVKMVAMINKGVYTNEGIEAIYAEAENFIQEE